MHTHEVISSCRICAGQCGLRLTVAEGRVVRAVPDRDNPQSRGYACIKGLYLHEAHNDPQRLLRPLKRRPDGTFEGISSQQALDEIAARLQAILRAHGPEAIAGFRGTMSYTNLPANHMLPAWLAALGSNSFFSTMTIDQSAKWVTFERLGGWAGGRDPFATAQVLLLVGTNPLVSLSTFNFPLQDPLRALQAARDRGMRLIVIDPRRSETARHADLFLQPLPGEDVTLLAALLREILAQGWHDEAFCARHVHGLERLQAALEPFTPAYAATRAGVPAELIVRAARMFAHDARRGSAASGVGPDMGPHSNLAEHLVECLNVVCGRYARAGDPVPNPGVVGPRIPRRAQVIAPRRSWEHGPRSRVRNLGLVFGEKMSGALADEILTPGPGQIRALVVDGGNPVNAIPDQRRAAQALGALDLLVAIEPFMTATARLSHYILPPRLMFERHDLGSRDYESIVQFQPYAMYNAPVVEPPPGSDLVDDWYVFWALARRLGRTIVLDGAALDMDSPPSTEDILRLLARHGQVPFDEIKRHPHGAIHAVPAQFVEAADPDCTARFDVAPDDVAAELAAVRAEPLPAPGAFALRLAVRRMRAVSNTMFHHLPAIRRRHRHNPAFLHPEELAAHGIADGDRIAIVSAHGRVEAIARADADVRRGVISMAHGWGGLPDAPPGGLDAGVCTNLLLAVDDRADPINSMPVMTGEPVRVERLDR
ncbi:MAG: molybdopterin-dependent oxidoreductase [Gammaproteobacteria bacterium]